MMYLMVDFASKVRWRKRFDKNPLFVELQDKLKIKEIAALHGIKSARALYITKDPSTIPFDKLPPTCFIKANHGCGWNILVSNSKYYKFYSGKKIINQQGNGIDPDKAATFEVKRQKVVEICIGWLKRKLSQIEWAYLEIDPKIYVEEFVTAPDQGFIQDLRLFTFDGEVKAIGVGSPKYRRDDVNFFLTPERKLFSFPENHQNLPDPFPEKPTNLSEILAAAHRLGKGIDFVRFDFFNSADGLLIAEATIYPEAGNWNSPSDSKVFNKWLGDQWKLSISDTFMAFLWNYYAWLRDVLHLK